MNRQRILDEIKRTAADNDGVPLGLLRFQKVTGINRDAWLGKFWRRWSEAVEEAGFTPNLRSAAFEREALVEHLAVLTREHRRFPTDADIGLANVSGARLPHKHRFRKLGTVRMRVDLVRQFAREHADYQDILAWLPATDGAEPETDTTAAPHGVDGAVYMLKLGKHYKIGKSFRVPQRHREISIELPEKPDVIHVITTDDPTGIEAYWHARFAEKRTNGEWFSLSRDEIAAFKRRRFM
jgi:hypothetical protein